MKKIWDRKSGVKINEKVEDYTVGIDYILDLELLPYDIKGTIAHAKMLKKIKASILRHKFLSFLIIAILAAVIYFGYGMMNGSKSTTTYTTSAVTKGIITTSVSGSGQVSAARVFKSL